MQSTPPLSTPAPAGTVRRGSARGALFAVVTMFFGYMMLENGLPAAFPTMQQALGVSAPAIAWVFTGLMMSNAILTPLTGRLGDIRDKRTVLIGAMVAVAVGTLLPALAENVVLLTAGQILQGAGGGYMALAVGLLNDTQSPERARMGNGLLFAAGGVGTVAGLLITGIVLTALPYTSLYWIALAVMLVAIAVAWKSVPAAPPVKQGRVDWSGAALFAAGLACVLLGITLAAEHGWSSPPVLGLILGGVAVLAVFAAVELRIPEPLVELRLLRGRPVLLTCAVAFVAGFGTTALLVSIPMLVALPAATGYGLGGTATLTGLYLLPLGVVALIAAPLTGRLERRIGVRWVIALSNAAMLAGALILLAVPHAPWVIAVASGMVGLTIGVGMTQAMNIVMATVPAERVASVSALSLVARSVGGALGSQITAGLVAGSTIPGTPLPAWDGFASVFVVLGGIGLVALLLSLVFPARLTPRHADA
ncbi:MFS transporter [Streptomyces sp. NPDC056716]|uniref:MFS transporter n=1 Tax=unclassified Streptomyces TaxID=2593676 RepID=UPI00367C156F